MSDTNPDKGEIDALAGELKFIHRDEDCRESEECTMNQMFKLLRFFSAKLETHMKDEGAQYKTLDEKLDALSENIQAQGLQITAQSKQIGEQSETVNSMMVLFKAFPEDEEGIVDIHGHRHYHTSKIKAYKESEQRWRRIWDDLLQRGITAVVTGTVFLIGYGAFTWLQNALAAAKVVAKVVAP